MFKKIVKKNCFQRYGKEKKNITETNEIWNYVCDFLLQNLRVGPVNDFRHRVAKLRLCKPRKEFKLKFA